MCVYEPARTLSDIDCETDESDDFCRFEPGSMPFGELSAGRLRMGGSMSMLNVDGEPWRLMQRT